MKNSLFVIFSIFAVLALSSDIHQSFSPPNVTRVSTVWHWCSCGQGLSNLTIWPRYKPQSNFTISVNTIRWIKFQEAVERISWKCDNSRQNHSSYINLRQGQWLSVLHFNQSKDSSIFDKCSKQTGKIRFNIWNTTSFVSSIPFTSHSEGYACFKIPTLLRTAKGTLIAFSEARTPGCDDFDRTDLVYKRSFDQGRTWSTLKVLVSAGESGPQNQGQCGHALVIGNISPVQLKNTSKRHPGRILAPYTRNNFKLWITYSDDDGQSWQDNHEILGVSQTAAHPDCNRNMSYFGYKIDQLKVKNLPDFIRFFELICRMRNPYDNPGWTAKLKGPWQFIGVGPSRGLQLKSGRVLIPGYVSPIRGLSGVPGTIPISQLYNNFNKGFVLISDDDGESWKLGKQWPVGQGSNEHQLVELDDGNILSNSRSLSTGSPQFRLQSVSFTEGQVFTASQFTQIPQPFAGCQGSTVGGHGGKLYVTSPNPNRGKSVLQYLVDSLACKINLNGRERLSLWVSRDNGKSYKEDQVIDPGLSAQTSLQQTDNSKFSLLYEQADPLPETPENILFSKQVNNLRVLTPTRFVFRELELKYSY